MGKKNTTKLPPVFLKVTYFDEIAAQDYIDIVNGGHLDWSKEENKERIAKMLAEMEAQAQGGFNIINFIKASISGSTSGSVSGDMSRIFGTTLKNTLLTDYISVASNDERIKKFEGDAVYAPDNSVSMYKMYSSYMTIVPQEEMPVNMEKLNDALLGERGYYAMLLAGEEETKNVLRFNINSFKNGYSLADLSKMKLYYYGVKVGTCTKEQLTLEKEFEVSSKKEKLQISAEDILDGKEVESKNNSLDIYDIVLAGVVCE